ncbi:MAG TPA: hypothetical protein VM120_27890 [Bryobacteraceae bacterium]|nr:hypothetical protein [Bryobacteraceae bacterium]
MMKTMVLNVAGMLLMPTIATLVSLPFTLLFPLGRKSKSTLFTFGFLCSAVGYFVGVALFANGLEYFDLRLSWWPVVALVAVALRNDYVRVMGSPDEQSRSKSEIPLADL